MEWKQQAAAEAVAYIRPHTRVGLGAGTTMAFMAQQLQAQIQQGLQLTVFSSSAETRQLLHSLQIPVGEIAATAYLDQYFDGCDQFDRQLNALKSGGGIHTTEKLLAAMAAEFILVGDESKYTDQLDTRYPLVIEVLPDALSFAEEQLKQVLSLLNRLERRTGVDGQLTQTVYGNYLVNIWFDQFPDPAGINPLLKTIPGIVETSLFYDMATLAIVAGENGVRTIGK